MKMRLLPLAISALLIAPVPAALALDEAAVMRRLEQLEAQRRADQAEIEALRQQVQQLQGPADTGVVTGSEAARLRAEIARVDQRTTSRIESVKRSLDNERDNLRVNGYLSVYGVRTTKSAVNFGTGDGDGWNFRQDAAAGIQFDYKVSDRANAVVQFLARGSEDFDVEASWAFLRYSLTPDTTVRMGRMATPMYLYTESVDVGFTYPWVRPPVEVYGTQPLRYQGIELAHTFKIGDWFSTVSALFGDSESDDARQGFDSNYTAGIVATLANDYWTLRAAHLLSADTDLHVLGARLSGDHVGDVAYYSLAARYDDGAWLALVEGRRYTTSDALDEYLPSREGFYGTLGYQFNRLMPYITWAKDYSIDDGNLAPGFAQGHQESLGLGLRYQLSDRIVLKGETTHYNAFDGTPGASGLVTGATPRILDDLDDDGATVMSLGFDAIF